MKNYFFILFLFFTFFKINAQKDSLQKKIDSLEIKLLKEVTVESKKKLFERKVDRLVFNVENSIQTTGGDAIDALKVTPGIRVENDKISMIGKSGMSVMIDDRMIQLSGEDLINYLRSIPSDNIKSIEVITTPPAKYEAQGNSGIINIQLKKAKKDSWNASLRSSYTQATYPSGNIGGTFSYQKNKLNIDLNINYTYSKYRNKDISKIYYPKNIWDINDVYISKNKNLSTKLLISYQFTKKLNLGFQYLINYSKPKLNDNTNTEVIGKNQYARITNEGENNRERNSNGITLFSIISLDSIGKKINIDLDYFDYKMTNNRIYYGETINSNIPEIENKIIFGNDLSIQKNNNYSVKIDVEYPLKWIKLNYGTKISFSKINNNVLLNNNIIPLEQINNDLFNYNENIQALYFSANKKFGKEKWEIQFGLRSENTQTKGESISLNEVTNNNYFKLFPTFYLSYIHNKNHNFNLNYNKRIHRPYFNDLNPFKWYNNQFDYSTGNPLLKPVFVNNLELGYLYKDYLKTSLEFSYEVDNYSSIKYFEENSYNSITTKINYFNDYSLGFSQIYVYNKLKWFKSTNQGYFYYIYSKSKIFPITPKETEGYNGGFYTNNSFNLSKITSLGFIIQHYFPSKTGSFEKNESKTIFNIYSKFSLLNDKLQLSISINNILKTYDNNTSSIRNDIYNTYKGFYDSRFIRFSLNYKFGNIKIREKSKTSGNEDEKQRSN